MVAYGVSSRLRKTIVWSGNIEHKYLMSKRLKVKGRFIGPS
jgi:hypothetical protein